ncbi:uncharacterized protein NESG_00899 [Nematocida ausubeli]|uniref:Uncharacterized protein n=2 Tax=Nematocida ausubeli (strain ATCC PRA-371 / ERTm2) TaxID=1913371 RepID=A0A086J3M7_NEMA1|nr:uncharacterized protein NESG_00899 [Nematocida ausubeli]KFG26745.1 hypothetical protein NESG_00899 [Nematocida ausubeli]
MEELKEKTEEVYCLDVNKDLNMVISGGGNDAVTFHAFNGEEYLIDEVIEGFEDSIIMTEFVSSDKAVAVSMDGTVASIAIKKEHGGYTKEIKTVDVQMDITKAVVSKDKQRLYIGTADGLVEELPNNIDEIGGRAVKVYAGHSSEIQDILESDTCLYIVSSGQIIVFNKETGSVSARYNAELDSDIRVVQINSTGKSLGVGYGNGSLVILSYSPAQNRLVNVYQSDNSARQSIESLLFFGEMLIYGDFASTVSVLDTKYKTEKTCRIAEEQECVIKIIAVSDAVCIAVTNTGNVSVVSLRADNTIICSYALSSITLNAVVFNRFICAATVEGIEFLKL